MPPQVDRQPNKSFVFFRLVTCSTSIATYITPGILLFVFGASCLVWLLLHVCSFFLQAKVYNLPLPEEKAQEASTSLYILLGQASAICYPLVLETMYVFVSPLCLSSQCHKGDERRGSPNFNRCCARFRHPETD